MPEESTSGGEQVEMPRKVVKSEDSPNEKQPEMEKDENGTIIRRGSKLMIEDDKPSPPLNFDEQEWAALGKGRGSGADSMRKVKVYHKKTGEVKEVYHVDAVDYIRQGKWAYQPTSSSVPEDNSGPKAATNLSKAPASDLDKAARAAAKEEGKKAAEKKNKKITVKKGKKVK